MNNTPENVGSNFTVLYILPVARSVAAPVTTRFVRRRDAAARARAEPSVYVE